MASDTDDLAARIDETRIVYEDRDPGVRIHGQAFICEFDESVAPEMFCDTITTTDDPWRMFGIVSQLADDYWKVKGNLFHVNEGDLVDASPITLEVAQEWVRIYVKEGCSAERAAAFVRALDEEYGVSVEFTTDSGADS